LTQWTIHPETAKPRQNESPCCQDEKLGQLFDDALKPCIIMEVNHLWITGISQQDLSGDDREKFPGGICLL